MGVPSNGSYGIEEGLIYSFPIKVNPDRSYSIVQGLEIDDFAREKMDLTMKELQDERDAAVEFCQDWQAAANLWETHDVTTATSATTKAGQFQILSSGWWIMK